MELMQEVKGFSDSREEEEEEEAAAEIITREESRSKQYYLFSSPSLSSPSTTNHTTRRHHHHVIDIPQPQNPWLGMIHDDHHQQSPEGAATTESHYSPSGLGLHQQDAASNFINHRRQLDFVALSLGNNKDDEANFQGTGGAAATVTTANHTHGHATSSGNNSEPAEREHMFDKVVTPSDVGKLNRLVIPKQHAEKYFPLDSAANEKGLLLNFEDRNGKLWRFRYSYWNSSQSYVMTKGWSRFVKEKKLDAGDIVSFQRGVGELYRHRLYIDWRRRPDHGHDPSAALIAPFFLPNQPQLSQYSLRWGGRFYPLSSPLPPSRHHDHLQQLNYHNMHPFHHQQQHHHGGGSHHYNYNELNSGSGPVCYLRSTQSMQMDDQSFAVQQQEGGNNIVPIIIDSVPVAHHHPHGGKSGSRGIGTSSSSTAGKRLRLFGVNMECESSSPSEVSSTSVGRVTMANSLTSSSLQWLREPHEDPL